MSHMPVSSPTLGRVLPLPKSAEDPNVEADEGLIYTKETAGIVQIFARSGDGTVYQVTPTPVGGSLNGVYWIDAKLDHGANGLGGADDRAAVLATLNAAATAAAAGTGNVIAFFPAGFYDCSRSGSNSYSVDVPGSGYTILGVPDQTWFRHPTGMPNASVAILRIDDAQDITIRDCGFDGQWGNAVTTVTQASFGQSLSAVGFTLNVKSTTGFPSSGTFGIVTPAGRTNVTYAAKTATSFTGCSGGTGTAHAGDKVGYLDANTGINHTTQADPKNYGLMIRGGRNIRVENCRFRQNYGDGLWIGRAADDDPDKPSDGVHVIGCEFDIMARNGISLGSAQQNIYIDRCKFTNIFTTAIDSEPQSMSGYSRNVWITRSKIGGWWDQASGGGNNNLISCAGGYVIGNNQTSACRGWRIIDNEIDGCTLIFTSADIVMRGNRIVCDFDGGTPRAPVFLDHCAQDITIDDNYIYDGCDAGLFASHIHDGAIQVQFYSGGTTNNQPSTVKITNNRIHARKGNAGIFVDGVGGFSRGDGTATLSATSGTATAVTSSTLTHTGAGWTVDRYEGWEVVIGGVRATIESNTSEVLTLAVLPLASTAWYTPLGTPSTTPSTGTYVITSVSGVCDISNNEIDCGADGNTSGGNGIWLFNDRAGGRIRCFNNKIHGANTWGIRVDGAATKPLLFLELVDNKFWDTQPTPTLSACIRFQTAESLTSITKLIMRGNTPMNGSTTALSLGGGSSGTWLLEDGDTQRWTGFGAPSMSAPKGSTYQRKDPADGNTTFYVNASGSTTWTALTG